MRTIENRCCDCAVGAYPCLGSSCPRRKMEVIYCDNCGAEIEDEIPLSVDGNDYCESCFNEIFEEEEE